MKKLILILLAVSLAACEVTAVQDVSKIRSKIVLDKNIQIPQNIDIVWYAGPDELERVYRDSSGAGWWVFRTGPKMQSALELVLDSFFDKPKKLKLDSQFHYLLKFSSNPTYSNGFGTYTVDLTMKVLDPSGNEVYSITTNASDSPGIVNVEAFHNVYAKAAKDALTQFLNSLGAEKLQAVAALGKPSDPTIDVRQLLGSIKPASSATGFYINDTGQVLTAAHAIDECMIIETQQQGEIHEANTVASSKVLDLAVLETNSKPKRIANLLPGDATPALGMPLFATGYPLSAIMSDYPSMTLGNLSSLGGLKGSKGLFQFSAPIQPGNSGGPVTDYKGRTLGVVTSTLNQAMMLNTTGTTAQNVNFAIDNQILAKFLERNQIDANTTPAVTDFEEASKQAVDYTVQVLCYK